MKKFTLPLIILIGLILRLLYIDSRGIQYDDAFSIILSARPIPEIISGTAADTMPPAYYFILHYWLLIGNSIWFIRIPGIVFSIFSIIVLYKIISEFISNDAGLYAAAIAAISPMMIYHAQDIRCYSLLLLSIMLYYLFFIKTFYEDFVTRKQYYYIGGMVISGAIAMYTHNIAIFFITSPGIYLAITRRWNALFRFAVALVTIILLFLPWGQILIGQITKVQRAFWTPQPGFIELIQLLVMYTATLPLPTLLLNLAVLLTLFIFIALIYVLRLYITRRSPQLLLFSIFIIPLILIFTASYLTRPLLIPRVTIASAMVYYGLLGFIISDKINRIPAVVIVVGLIICVLISLPYQINYSEFPRSPYKEAFLEMSRIKQPEKIVIHQNKQSYFPTKYYYPDLKQEFLPDEPGSMNDTLAYGSEAAMGIYPSENIHKASSNYQYIDYVVFSKVIDEYIQNGLTGDPDLIWLKTTYSFTGMKKFNDLEVYSFRKNK